MATLVSTDEIVKQFISEFRSGSQREKKSFENLPDLRSAIRKAALCESFDGKRHSHQRRIPRLVLELAESKLQAAFNRLQRAIDFEALHKYISDEIWSIRGIGDLTVYDIAQRIGAFRKLSPRYVYLHAGTKEGASALGLSGERILPSDLPLAFSQLTPSEIEDCLCLFKAQLAGGDSWRSLASGSCADKPSVSKLRRVIGCG